MNEPPFHAGMDYDRNTGKMIMYMLSNATVIWVSEGSYKPIIGIFYKDETNQTMIAQDFEIKVYPRAYLTEVQSSITNIYLSIAVFIFSFFGVFSVASDLWPKSPDKKLTNAIRRLNKTNFELQKTIIEMQKHQRQQQDNK